MLHFDRVSCSMVLIKVKILRNSLTRRIYESLCIGSTNLQRKPGNNVVVSGVMTKNQLVSCSFSNQYSSCKTPRMKLLPTYLVARYSTFRMLNVWYSRDAGMI